MLAVLCASIDVIAAVCATGWWALIWINHSDTDTPIQSAFRIFALVFAACHILNNFIVTSLIGGRILWVSYALNRGWGTTRNRQFHFRTITALLFESGFLYLISGIIYTVLGMPQDWMTQIDASSVLIQVAGVAPTLLIVRANKLKEERVNDERSRPVSTFMAASGEQTVSISLNEVGQGGKL
ncbi:hypothetical protein PM082_009608 [Marasmius tenuissimus]|nr:hypothetical protein PM082_009608 [Marasmius tenuissimus]